MKKPSTTTVRRMGKLPDRQLTIGLDLGDRSSFYFVLNGSGEEHPHVFLHPGYLAMAGCGCRQGLR
jgi:hypothetical protein